MGQKEKEIFHISEWYWCDTCMPLDLRSWQTAKNGKACKSLSITENLNLNLVRQNYFFLVQLKVEPFYGVVALVFFTWAACSSKSIIAFSRNERTHPNFVSQAREISTFLWRLQFGSPSWFFQGLWLPGSRVPPHGEECVASLRRSAWEAMFVLSWFGIFFELGFHSDCVQPKRECSPM